MMKKSVLVVIAAVGLTSCLKDPVESDTTRLGKEQEKIMEDYVTSNGLTAKKEAFYDLSGNYFPVYTMIETKGDSGTRYTQNEAIRVAYTIRTLENKVVETKTAADSVLLYEGGKNYTGKIDGLSVLGSALLGKGGKGRFLIPSTLGYGANPPGGVEYNAVLMVDVEVLDRLSEPQQIAFYVKRNNFKATQVTDSGLMFSRTTTTTDSVAKGPTVKVKYIGKFANGVVFDKNETGATFELSGVVPGFAEAIKLMRKGEKATAILPSKIAYGENGGGRMPVYMPLIFDIEVLDSY